MLRQAQQDVLIEQDNFYDLLIVHSLLVLNEYLVFEHGFVAAVRWQGKVSELGSQVLVQLLAS